MDPSISPANIPPSPEKPTVTQAAGQMPSVTANSPAVPPPTPTKKKTKWIIIGICIGIPVAILVYRLISGWWYSPENAYKRNEQKVQAESAKAIDELTSQMTILTKNIEKAAADIPSTEAEKQTVISYRIDTQTQTRTTTLSSEIPENQAELRGRLIRFAGGDKISGCFYKLYMGGSKFNTYPVGEEATCAAEVLAKYVWTGDRKTLSDEIQQTIKESGVTLKEDSYTAVQPGSSGKITVDYQVKTKASTNSSTALQDAIDGVSGNWGKKLVWEKNLKEPDLPTEVKNRVEKTYIVSVHLSKEYLNLFERKF